VQNSVLGQCPVCGENVVDSGNECACASCDFCFAKKQMEKQLTEKEIGQLLTKGRTGLVKGLIDSDGILTKAIIFINNDDFTLGFDYKRRNKAVIIAAAAVGFMAVAVIAEIFFFSSETPDSPEPDFSEFPYDTIEITSPAEPPATLVTVPPTSPIITTSPTPPTSPPTIAEPETSDSPATTATAPTSQTSAATATSRVTATSRTTTTSRTAATSRTSPTTAISLTTTASQPTAAAPISPPATPTSLRASVNASGNIVISWAAVADADGYEISRSATMIGGYRVIDAITVRDGSRVRITDSGVTGGAAFYSVRAFRNVGGGRVWSEHSEIVTAG
jgi:hypothetical protein